MRDGTLAFLPLADGTSSIVWSADDDVASTLLAASPIEFASELDRASDLALGATRLVSERASFPLRRLAAHRYVAQRVALIGDAAHVVHPLAGQGVNLGLLDAAALAQLMLDARREREDPGALRVLRQYERWRKSEVAFMSSAIDAFDRFLAHGTGPLSRLAQRGLGWVNRSQELKRLFIGRALGTEGELPRAAQRSTSSADSIQLRRADEVVIRQPFDGVGGKQHPAIVVADLEVRVVVFDVGHVGEGIHEAHRAVEVPERELAADRRRVGGELPVRGELFEQLLGFAASEGRDAPLTGFALPFGEIGHARSLSGTACCSGLAATPLFGTKLRFT